MITDNFEQDFETATDRRTFLKIAGFTFASLALPRIFGGKAEAAEKMSDVAQRIENASLSTPPQSEGSATKTSIPEKKPEDPIQQYCGEKGYCTADEARAVSAKYIVVHYTEDVEFNAKGEERLLRRKGYPAIALPADPASDKYLKQDGLAKLYIATKSPKRLYSARDINFGEITGMVEKLERHGISVRQPKENVAALPAPER